MLQEIESFLTFHNMPSTKFSRLTVSDPVIIDDMRRGRQPSQETLDRIKHFMENYRG